jgi:hypothetical protein
MLVFELIRLVIKVILHFYCCITVAYKIWTLRTDFYKKNAKFYFKKGRSSRVSFTFLHHLTFEFVSPKKKFYFNQMRNQRRFLTHLKNNFIGLIHF